MSSQFVINMAVIASLVLLSVCLRCTSVKAVEPDQNFEFDWDLGPEVDILVDKLAQDDQFRTIKKVAGKMMINPRYSFAQAISEALLEEQTTGMKDIEVYVTFFKSPCVIVLPVFEDHRQLLELMIYRTQDVHPHDFAPRVKADKVYNIGSFCNYYVVGREDELMDAIAERDRSPPLLGRTTIRD